MALPLAAGALWLVPQLARAATVSDQRAIMGTVVDIRVHHGSGHSARRAVDAAWAEMQRLENMMSRYVPGNPLTAIHAAAGIQPVEVPTELMTVLQAAQVVSEASQGAFDVTIGALQDWDFRPGHFNAATPDALKTQLPLVHQRDLVLNIPQSTAMLRRQGMRLDLGGIAKLPILQAGLRTLQQHGISSAMLNGGGDVLVAGGQQGAPWHIGVRDPLRPQRLLGTIALHDGVVASSGDYERCFEVNGQRFHHVLDPHTGYPSNGPHGVVFVAPEAARVSGWGAATMVAGLAFGQKHIRALRGVDGLIVNQDGSTWMNTGMQKRLKV
jgi:thiamine biosynthesis lipoprotein